MRPHPKRQPEVGGGVVPEGEVVARTQEGVGEAMVVTREGTGMVDMVGGGGEGKEGMVEEVATNLNHISEYNT